jgi:hypothetical protein
VIATVAQDERQPFKFKPVPKAKPPHVPNFKAAVKYLHDDAFELAVKEVREFAKYEAGAFRHRIEQQDFQAFKAIPLSAGYAARKKAKGRDPRTMIATRNYLENIKVFRRDNPDGSVTIFVGHDEDTPAKDLSGNVTDIKLWEVARVQELGSEAANIPPRPHWGPHFDEMRQRVVPLRRGIAFKIVTKANAKLKK